MQNQQKFLEILKNPYDLDKNTLPFLEKLVEEYPYCQSLQILLAKNLQNFDKLVFEKQVNKAAAYAVNRRKFQKYISGRDRFKTEMEPEVQPTNKEISAEQTPHDATGNTGQAKPLANRQEKNISTSVVHPIDELKRSGPPTKEKTQDQSRSLIEIVKRRLDEIQNKGKQQYDGKQKNDRIDQKKSSLSDPILKESKLPASEAIVNNNSIEKKVVDKPNHEPIDKNKEGELPAKEATTSNELFPYPTMGKQAKKPDINYLIDKFLKEEPRIKAKKDLPEKQEDLSVKSTYENPQLVTETLAHVYLKQGNKDKALDIYEKLCLKFPEKSSYFAQKIIAIKNEIN